MNRRTTLVTAGVTALVAVTASAAVAVNTGLLSVPDEDAAGTLQLPASITEVASEAPAEPTDVETVYVDVYDQPGEAPAEEVVIVPAPPDGATTVSASTDDGYGEDEYDDDHEDDEDHEYDDDEHEYDDDEYEDDHEEEDDEDEHEEEEYEGRDDDD